MPGQVTCLVRSWPRLSQTFILNEVLALERLGLQLTVVSLTHSRESARQPQLAAVRAPVHYLDQPRPHEALARVADHVTVGLRAPRRYASALMLALRRPDLADGEVRLAVHAAIGAIQSTLFFRSGLADQRLTELLEVIAHGCLGTAPADP